MEEETNIDLFAKKPKMMKTPVIKKVVKKKIDEPRIKEAPVQKQKS